MSVWNLEVGIFSDQSSGKQDFRKIKEKMKKIYKLVQYCMTIKCRLLQCILYKLF